MGSIKERRWCKEDDECPDGQYCYKISERCVDYSLCSRYNRQEAEKLSRDPSQCGPCMKGYTAEVLGTGETAFLCNKVTPRRSDSIATTDTAVGIGIFVAISSCFIVAIILGIIIFRRRYFNKRQVRCTEKSDDNWDELTKASAPPTEDSPFIGVGKGNHPSSHNNNKSVIDNNKLVAAMPFNAPRWVSNSIYNGDNSDDDGTNTPNEQTIVSQLPAIDDINSQPSRQLTLQLPELTTEHQDNARNTALTHPLSSNHSHTSEPNDNRTNHDGTRTSNVLIKQNITMNVKVINGDEY